jgi:hypothetical protein
LERGEEMRRKQLGRVRKKGGEGERDNKKRYLQRQLIRDGGE